MLLMFEKGIRGGISSIMHRYGKVNNKYMKEDCNPKEPRKYLTYLDANNFYGFGLCPNLYQQKDLNGLLKMSFKTGKSF